jgi:hypothetical protein
MPLPFLHPSVEMLRAETSFPPVVRVKEAQAMSSLDEQAL